MNPIDICGEIFILICLMDITAGDLKGRSRTGYEGVDTQINNREL
jgi:hypothetical protein